jgi:hypothetical protein
VLSINSRQAASEKPSHMWADKLIRLGVMRASGARWDTPSSWRVRRAGNMVFWGNTRARADPRAMPCAFMRSSCVHALAHESPELSGIWTRSELSWGALRRICANEDSRDAFRSAVQWGNAVGSHAAANASKKSNSRRILKCLQNKDLTTSVTSQLINPPHVAQNGGICV